MLDDVVIQLRDYGLIVDHPVVGQLTRCDVDGDRAHSRNGWYSLFEVSLDNGKKIIAGAYGSWKRQDTQKIWLKGHGVTPEERKAINARVAENKRIAQEQRNEAARKAANRAARFWEQTATGEGASPYLVRKQVDAFGVRFAPGDVLVLSMRNIQGAITGLQFIYPEKNAHGKDKQFWPSGMRKSGSFFVIGDLEPGQPIFFAEGYATAASVHQAIKRPVVVVFDSGNILPCAKALRGAYQDSAFVFCADDDWQTTDHKGEPYNPGVMAAEKASREVGGDVVRPVFKSRQNADIDFNDLHVSEGLASIERCFAPVFKKLNHWRSGLSRTANGILQGNLRNVVEILSNDDDWQGVIGFSELSYCVIKRKVPPFTAGNFSVINNEWLDDDTARLDVWLAEKYGINAKTATLDAGVELVARNHAFHPVRDYLSQLEWDGTNRLELWLRAFLGAEHNEYNRLVGIKWMVGAVARVMRYPIKVDNLIILEGAQGAGKSTVFSILGGAWYSDTHFALGDKDGYQQMLGVWICELAELDSFNKAESSRAKSFFTSTVDRYRPSYGRRAQDFPRQCVFGGSVNNESYLKDPTGNRRYWPVRCNKVDLEGLKQHRDQMWAEAVYLFNEGNTPWHVLNSEEHLFSAQQEQRLIVDSWEDVVSDWLADNPVAIGKASQGFTLSEIFELALGMNHAQMKPPEQARLVGILTRLGYVKRRPKLDPDGPRSRRINKYFKAENG